ncbi:unnamed protein product [Albugo candida]|uniref:protein-serine/threonine phosphatase n=1 Tax=Albugo candida TaxID=65357 RepID=A0A024GHK7_9STRA|nr:unnamed protein product [Albugo candida]|eukprot:CCI45828.1 unnamed protein product [Albugo candida]
MGGRHSRLQNAAVAPNGSSHNAVSKKFPSIPHSAALHSSLCASSSSASSPAASAVRPKAPISQSLRERSYVRKNSIRSSNTRRDVFSVFADHGVVLNRFEKSSNSLSGDSSSRCGDVDRDDELRVSSSHSMSDATTSSEVSEASCYQTRLDHEQFVEELNLKYGIASDKGLRLQNEDRTAYHTKDIAGELVAYFGLYDGHGGAQVCDYLEQNLHAIIFDQIATTGRITDAIIKAYASTDESIFQQEVQHGSTAVSVIIRGSELFLSSLGDSRVVLCHDGKAINVFTPHTPKLSSEYERICAAKGSVIQDRIFGVLGVSRAFGDNDFKTSRGRYKDRFNGDIVSGSPDVTSLHIDRTMRFILVGCDGLFDILTSQQIVDFVCMKSNCADVQQIAQDLVAYAISAGSTDNVSVILIYFGGVDSSSSHSQQNCIKEFIENANPDLQSNLI